MMWIPLIALTLLAGTCLLVVATIAVRAIERSTHSTDQVVELATAALRAGRIMPPPEPTGKAPTGWEREQLRKQELSQNMEMTFGDSAD